MVKRVGYRFNNPRNKSLSKMYISIDNGENAKQTSAYAHRKERSRLTQRAARSKSERLFAKNGSP